MFYKRLLRYLANNVPYIKKLKAKVLLNEASLSSLKASVHFYESSLAWPPGHFYSPVVNTTEIIEHENSIFSESKSSVGINLNEEEQFKLLNYFKEYYKLLTFPAERFEGKRYFYNNNYYSYSDVIFLFSTIMHYKPKRIIEVGSGFSSAAMLDINEQFFNNSIHLTFIEPFPENLKQIIKPNDQFTLIEKKVQDVDLNIFKSLQENDILFIDSTHVAKTNSDVLFELFEVLPSLNKGVKIHFHDIFFPFEYPRVWVVDEKRSWNEIYFFRSFLMYNNSFRILTFNTFLEKLDPKWFEENMPLCLKNTGGSCWLEKVV